MSATTGNDTKTGVFCADAENPLGTEDGQITVMKAVSDE